MRPSFELELITIKPYVSGYLWFLQHLFKHLLLQSLSTMHELIPSQKLMLLFPRIWVVGSGKSKGDKLKVKAGKKSKFEVWNIRL